MNGDCQLLSSYHIKILGRGRNLPEKKLRMHIAEIVVKRHGGGLNCAGRYL